MNHHIKRYEGIINMQDSNTIVSSIFKSRKVLLEQLDYLGYNTDDYMNFSISEINVKFTNKQLDMLLEMRKEDPDTGKKKKIYVLYHLAKAIRPNNIDEFIDDLYNIDDVLTKEDTLLIISKDETNETLVNYLKHIWETENTFIVVQNIKRLQFNIHEHTLVPKHRIMNKEECDKVRKKYNILKDTQLPEISRFDPVAQSLCMRPGEICEILRPSKTAIVSSYYRLCI